VRAEPERHAERPRGRCFLDRFATRVCSVGGALVEALLSRAGEARLSLATLNVYPDNAAAMTLYSDLGFERAERPVDDLTSPGVWFMRRRIGP